MIIDDDNGTQKPSSAPKCVSQLLATFDSMALALSDDGPKSPYAFDAIFEDLSLCPALFANPALAGDRDAGLVDAIEQARSAVRVVKSCPGSDRQWAIERLRAAVEAARLQLEQRVRDAEASGDTSGLFTDRCSTCVFIDH